jgi:hypothetical protein
MRTNEPFTIVLVPRWRQILNILVLVAYSLAILAAWWLVMTRRIG